MAKTDYCDVSISGPESYRRSIMGGIRGLEHENILLKLIGKNNILSQLLKLLSFYLKDLSIESYH